MDIETRLQKIEAQVHQVRILAWVVLALVLAIGLGFLLVAVELGLLPIRALIVYVELTLLAVVLVSMICLLVFYLLAAVISTLRQFRTSREADAQAFQQAIAERTEDQGQDPGL